MPFRIQKENSDAKGESESFGFSTTKTNAHYFIRQRKTKNFIFLWDQPIKSPDNSMNNSELSSQQV